MDYHPLPNINEPLAEVEPDAKHFGRIDFRSAYLQLPLVEFSQELTSIVTTEGAFCHIKTPFGIFTVPAGFQRYI